MSTNDAEDPSQIPLEVRHNRHITDKSIQDEDAELSVRHNRPSPSATDLDAELSVWHNRPIADTFQSKPSSYARSCATVLRPATPFSQLHCLPDDGACPSLWMLGSGGGSAGLAGQLGMGLALARFIAPQTCTGYFWSS